MDPRDVLTRPAPEPDLTLRYGDLPEHVADLYWPRSPADLTGSLTGEAPTLPDAADGPDAAGILVIVVHGGFWRAEYDRVHVRPMCVALAESGCTVASIEFRRTGQPGGGWPGTFDDVAAAADRVPGLVLDRMVDQARNQAPNQTIGRTVLLGHSAGGHLVTWAAGRASLPPQSPWHRSTAGADAAVSLAGVVDLAQAHRLHLDDDATADLLGGGPDEVPDRYAAADPAVQVPTIPVTLIHGTDDDIVPLEISRSYAARGLSDVRLIELTGIEHFGVIDPISPAWPTVLGVVHQAH